MHPHKVSGVFGDSNAIVIKLNRQGKKRDWKTSLKWQRLKPYEEFAKLVERHWDGIARSFLPTQYEEDPL